MQGQRPAFLYIAEILQPSSTISIPLFHAHHAPCFPVETFEVTMFKVTAIFKILYFTRHKPGVTSLQFQYARPVWKAYSQVKQFGNE